MNKVLYNIDEVAEIINKGKTVLLAGEEEILKKLPKGNWIGGTIPYFMSENGGTTSTEKILVTELPSFIKKATLKSYDINTISNIYNDAYENGFIVLIIPAGSDLHLSFAINSSNYDGYATCPIIGWISGVLLSDIGKKTAKVFLGDGKNVSENTAVAIHVELPSGKFADINTINIFNQGSSDTIEFLETSFVVTDVLINGEKQNMVDYVNRINVDVRLPLVANYSGTMINISFQRIDEIERKVYFYAPAFKGITYKQAAPVPDYIKTFTTLMPEEGTDRIFFSCNCILNYLYSELEGKKTGNITGPITFGEIAYQLLNQTLVYLEIKDL